MEFHDTLKQLASSVAMDKVTAAQQARDSVTISVHGSESEGACAWPESNTWAWTCWGGCPVLTGPGRPVGLEYNVLRHLNDIILEPIVTLACAADLLWTCACMCSPCSPTLLVAFLASVCCPLTCVHVYPLAFVHFPRPRQCRTPLICYT